jgi:exonuclease III
MILFLSETKIDASFPDAQFSIDNFTMWRADRNKFGGGVMVYIRSDLAADRKIQYEFREIESIGVEVTSEMRNGLLV